MMTGMVRSSCITKAEKLKRSIGLVVPPTSTSSYLLSKSEKTKAMKAMKMKNACSCTWESVGHQIQIEPAHQNVCFGRSRTCIEAQLVHNPTSNLPFQATRLRENKCIIHKCNSFRNLFPKTSTVPYLAYAQGRPSPFEA